LAKRADFWHFLKEGKSGRFAGVFWWGFREKGADLGPDFGFWSVREM